MLGNKKRFSRQIAYLHPIACGVSCLLTTLHHADMQGTEFSGGSLTSVLLQLQSLGALLFAVAAITSARASRVSAVATLCAVLICAPISIFSVAPQVYHVAFGHFSTTAPNHLVFETWNMFYVVISTTALLTSIVKLRSR